jgi:hypothetical protein
MYKAYCLFELSGCMCVACLNYQVSVELLYHKLSSFSYQVSGFDNKPSGIRFQFDITLTSTSLRQQTFTTIHKFQFNHHSTTNHTTIYYTNFSSTSIIQPSVRQTTLQISSTTHTTISKLVRPLIQRRRQHIQLHHKQQTQSKPNMLLQSPYLLLQSPLQLHHIPLQLQSPYPEWRA